MTPHQRQRVAYAPELAVIYALRAVADATCAALAAAYPRAQPQPPQPDDELATRLYGAICCLDRTAQAYCNYIEDLPQQSFIVAPDDHTF